MDSFGIQHCEAFLLAGIALNLTPWIDTSYILTRSGREGRAVGLAAAPGIDAPATWIGTAGTELYRHRDDLADRADAGRRPHSSLETAKPRLGQWMDRLYGAVLPAFGVKLALRRRRWAARQ